MPSLTLPRFTLRACGTALAAGALLAAGGVRPAHAGSFALSDQSPSAVGLSFAGAASSAVDPSTIFFNPASMGFLSGFQTESSYTYVSPRADFRNEGSRYVNPGLGGLPIRGSDGGGGARGASFGDTFLSATLFNSETYGKFNLGIAITVPFGEVVDYDPNWVGRYSSLRSSLRTIDYGLSASYRWKFISIGGGFDAQYSSAVLSNAVDFGLLGASLGLPIRPGSADGTLRLEGTDVSYGFNVGGIIEYLRPGKVSFLGTGRIGVSYRSGITQNYDGYVTFRNVPAFALSPGFGGAFTGQRATAKLELPEIYNFSLTQGLLNDKITLLAGATYTLWNRLQQIPITFSNPVSQASLASDPALSRPGLSLRYHDAVRVTGGIEYKPTKNLTLRVGGGWDESPVPDQYARSSRIPDGDRWLVSCGVKYHVFGFRNPIFKSIYVDTDIEASYLHLFINDPRITSLDRSGHLLNGSYDAQVNVASAAVIFRYGRADESERPAPKEGKDTYRK